VRPALLLIDLQRDFLARPRLAPHAVVLVERVRTLLAGCRERDVPVLHCLTRVAADGSDRMPHWRRAGIDECVAGTPGSEPPRELEPVDGEQVLGKRFFSAFGDGALEAALREREIDTLILAGNYLHGCVRATAFDAYERGFEVWIADDAVGTTEPDHAETTRLYLEGRAARLLPAHAILELLGAKPRSPVFHRRDPSDWERIASEQPLATDTDVAHACETAKRVAGLDATDALRACADLLEARTEELALLLAEEIGKPVRYGRAELRAAVAHVRSAARLERREHLRPHGVVGLITPWNNPIAIPLGKIAPALALGNRVVWKAAIEAPRAARAVLEIMVEAGVDPRAVQLLFGGAQTARMLIDRPEIGAVSLTGSIATGRAAAVRCLRSAKPLQAELGGNNAAIVLRDYDFAAVATDLARSAFAFAGQRCTAIRRFIVERSILPDFERAFVAAAESLPVGDPREEATEVGPLVSRIHRDAIVASLAGADLLCGGDVPERLERGCWLRPAVVRGAASESRLAREESFGPVALVLPADDLDDAIRIANGVEHGLAATLLCTQAAHRQRFTDSIAAGILGFMPGPFTIDAASPFGGWKSSGIGPPEHGRWDREFYTRPQARYGDS